MSVLVGKQAPDFCADAIVNGDFKEKFKLSDYKGKYVLFFFYPLDFTFVCPTELHAFQDHLEEFRRRNCEVIACSVDSKFSHHAWLNKPKKLGGIEGVTYPLVSDINKTIARDYDVLIPKDGVALRGTFLIDKAGVVKSQQVNELGIGRNVSEYLRLLDALQFTEEHGEVCPADWQKGKKAMKASQTGLKDFFG